MIERKIVIDGRAWTATLTGRFTVYGRDEVPVVFEHRAADGTRVRRLSRFSPLGSRERDQALAELTDAELATLWRQSQEEWTSPELGYVRR